MDGGNKEQKVLSAQVTEVYLIVREHSFFNLQRPSKLEHFTLALKFAFIEPHDDANQSQP